MAASKAFVALATVMLMVQLATAKNFTVGSPGGSWDRNTNFATWTKANTFTVGDNLIFSYSTGAHDVVEVTKANHDSCSIGSAIKTYTTGNDVIPLLAATTRYFICGFPGHCQGGMTLTVNVVAAAVTPPPKSSTPAPTPSPPAPSPAVTPPPSRSTPAPSPAVTPSPSGSTPASSPPAVTPPPSGSTPGPSSSGNSTPPSSTPSGAHNLQAKAAVGFGIGILALLAI